MASGGRLGSHHVEGRCISDPSADGIWRDGVNTYSWNEGSLTKEEHLGLTGHLIRAQEQRGCSSLSEKCLFASDTSG